MSYLVGSVIGSLVAMTFNLTIAGIPLALGLERFGILKLRLWHLLVVGLLLALLLQVLFGTNADVYIGYYIDLPLIVSGLLVLIASFLRKKTGRSIEAIRDFHRDDRDTKQPSGHVGTATIQAEGKAALAKLLASGHSESAMKLNRGLLRLWLLISAVWAVFCVYQLYSDHRAWEDGFAAAKSLAGALESRRNLMIQNYVFDSKAAHERAQKSGLPIEPFDEARTRDEAYSYSLRLLENDEEKRQVEQSYRHAFDSRNRRDSFLPWVPTVPVGTAFLFIAIPWVIRGFKK